MDQSSGGRVEPEIWKGCRSFQELLASFPRPLGGVGLVWP